MKLKKRHNNYYKQKFILSLIITLIIISCENETFIKRDYPFIKTLEVSKVLDDGSITLNAEILHKGSEDVLDHGFVWGTTSTIDLQSGSVASLGETGSIGKFSVDIKSGILADQKYYIRAFARNSSKTVYGALVDFETVRNSPKIEIEDFTPKNGTWGDEITITGKNFDEFKISNNVVQIAGTKVEILNAYAESIVFTVPTGLLSVSSGVSVTASGVTVSSIDQFTLNAPSISNVSPISPQIGDLVTLTGSNFYSVNNSINQLKVGNTATTITSASSNEIEFITPALATGDYEISLSVLEQETIPSQSLSVQGPSAGQFLPASGPPGTEVLISGTDFSTDISQIEVMFNQESAAVIESSTTSVKAIVPGILSGEYSIEVVSDGISIPFEGVFTVTLPPIPTDYVAYYPFNGNIVDESGQGFNGTISGTPTLTTDRNGQINSAYNFNDISDIIETSTQIDQNLTNGATFSIWINPFQLNKVQTFISNYSGLGASGACNGRIGFFTRIESDNSVSIRYAIDGNRFIGIKSQQAIESNVWQHLIFTWDGTISTNSFRMYLNGVQLSTSSVTQGSLSCTSTLIESTDPFRFGYHQCAAGPCQPFDGNLDDIRIYSRVLNDNEILSLAGE